LLAELRLQIEQKEEPFRREILKENKEDSLLELASNQQA
jgi:hypothetical protein